MQTVNCYTVRDSAIDILEYAMHSGENIPKGVYFLLRKHNSWQNLKKKTMKWTKINKRLVSMSESY